MSLIRFSSLFRPSIRLAARKPLPFNRQWVRAFASASEPIKTALYDAHVSRGGKMVDFAGYSLPVQYKDSIINSHMHCRNSASMFDVSHMGQIKVTGAQAIDFVENVVVGDIHALEVNQARLSLICNENGGILDDCIVTRKEDHVFMVVNGACKHTDFAHMDAALKVFNAEHNADVKMEMIQGRSLLALQGPKAAEVLAALLPASVDLPAVGFMYSFNSNVGSVEDCWVSRCGYTGEDGFEISVPNGSATALFELLDADERVLPAALGARDSLRLEAGLCLYGHDLDSTITPVEGTLLWTISKRRRAEGGFIGFDVINKQIKEKSSTKKRVGLTIKSGAPAREGAEILNMDGEVIGNVTSGTMSPVLKKKLSMGFVKKGYTKAGTQLKVRVRGKEGDAEVTKMPFVASNYYSPPN